MNNNPGEKSTLSQCVSVSLSYLTGSVIGFLFGVMLFWWFFTSPGWEYVTSIIFSLISFMLVYTAAHKVSLYDMKPYSPQTPNMKKSILLTLATWVPLAFILIIYEVTWQLASVEGTITSFSSTVNNMMMFILASPYSAFVQMNDGHLNVIGVIIMAAVPALGCVTGYASGMYGFSFFEKLNDVVYKKN